MAAIRRDRPHVSQVDSVGIRNARPEAGQVPTPAPADPLREEGLNRPHALSRKKNWSSRTAWIWATGRLGLSRGATPVVRVAIVHPARRTAKAGLLLAQAGRSQPGKDVQEFRGTIDPKNRTELSWVLLASQARRTPNAGAAPAEVCRRVAGDRRADHVRAKIEWPRFE